MCLIELLKINSMFAIDDHIYIQTPILQQTKNIVQLVVNEQFYLCNFVQIFLPVWIYQNHKEIMNINDSNKYLYLRRSESLTSVPKVVLIIININLLKKLQIVYSGESVSLYLCFIYSASL